MKYCFPRPLLTAVFWLVAHSGWAQAHKISLLRQYAPLPARLAPYLQKGETALFDRRLAANLLKNRPNALTLHFRFEQTDWELELVRHDIFSQGFFVSTGSHPNSRFPYQNHALHYKGTVKGRNNSMAAVSILNDQLVAVVSDGGQQVGGHINIGAVRETDLADEHIIYRDSDLRIVNEFACGTTEGASEGNTPLPDLGAPAALAAAINAEPVDMYFEADYSTYTNNGSNVTNVVNYVTALFNVVATIYDRDSILIKISGIKVWNVLDPYAGTTTTATALPAFGTAMANGFPGDLAHLLSQRGLGGGRAYVDVLCSGNSLKTAVSGNLSNSFGAFPTYSWSTMVIAHEAGHNFGSPHTQSCSWPGGAIDNCYATEGGCPPGPAPTNGGTIMSYCHLAAPGINLANGFGPLPGERIRSRVRNNTCIHPAVYFGTTVQSLVEENADVENNCLDYKLLTTKLLIPYKPSQPAAISLVPSGNTGLTIGPHGDVEIMPMNFVLDSSNLEQTIQLKVYNDALIENPETLTLNFTLNANGGNAVKRNSSTVHTLNITSLDHRPDSSVNELLYFEPFDTVTVGLGGWTQSVIHGNMSPNRWVVRNSGDAAFPTAAAYISNNGTANAYAGSSANDSTVVRLISPAINALTFSNIRLSYLYKCQGETMFVNGGGGTGSNGSMVGLDVGRVYVSTDNGSTWTLVRDNLAGRNIKNLDEVALPAAANNSPALRIAFEWVNNSSVVNNPPLLVDSISLRGTSAKAIQSAAHPANMDEALIGPFQTVHFYNPVTKNVMASLQNLSGHDFGCTKVELLRTGNGALPAWTAAADELVSAKAYRITAANNNATAPYRLTLYYTATEMNGWLAATGNSASNASIVKTDSNIVQLSPVSAPLFATAKSMANFGTAPHTAISGNFTGFSTFAMAKPFAQPLCPGNNIGYPANVPGSSYRWQMNTGSGFADLANGGIFSGVTADTLRLTAPPTSFYGHRFRCAITTGGNTVYSNEYLLKFGSTWLGGTSIDWENPANWSCGSLPDANTDVYVNNGATFYPQVNSSTTIRSLHTKPGTTVTIRDGAVLTVKN